MKLGTVIIHAGAYNKHYQGHTLAAGLGVVVVVASFLASFTGPEGPVTDALAMKTIYNRAAENGDRRTETMPLQEGMM
jgi:hypothetical protein